MTSGRAFAKCLVQKNMGPCAVPVLLVPKKDGFWHMCIESRATNNIIIDYRSLIPRLDILLDQLHGAAIFFLINLRSDFHKISL